MYMLKIKNTGTNEEHLEFFNNREKAIERKNELFEEVKQICEKYMDIITFKVNNNNMIEVIDFETFDIYCVAFVLTPIEVDKTFDIKKTLFRNTL